MTGAAGKQSADPPLFRLFNEVGILEQLARTALERVLPDGLLMPHFVVLNHLVRMGDGRSPVAIARALQVSKPTITNTLQRLAGRGLVMLTADDRDGRAKRVHLTESGRGARQAALAAIGPMLQAHADVLTAAELTATLSSLGRLRAALDQARDRPALDIVPAAAEQAA